MTDQEIYTYAHNNRSVYLDDLEQDVIKTSHQINGVYYDNICDLITIITSNNQFTFRRKFKKNERKLLL